MSAPETLEFAVREGPTLNLFLRRGPSPRTSSPPPARRAPRARRLPRRQHGRGPVARRRGRARRRRGRGRPAPRRRGRAARRVGVDRARRAHGPGARRRAGQPARHPGRRAHRGEAPAGTDSAVEAGPPVVLSRTTLDGRHRVVLRLAPRGGVPRRGAPVRPPDHADGRPGRADPRGSHGPRRRSPAPPIPRDELLRPRRGRRRSRPLGAGLPRLRREAPGRVLALPDLLRARHAPRAAPAPAGARAPRGARRARRRARPHRAGGGRRPRGVRRRVGRARAHSKRPAAGGPPRAGSARLLHGRRRFPPRPGRRHGAPRRRGRAREADPEILARRLPSARPRGGRAGPEPLRSCCEERRRSTRRPPRDRSSPLPGGALAAGDWRDSEEGLGGGRIPFNVNAALVPLRPRRRRGAPLRERPPRHPPGRVCAGARARPRLGAGPARVPRGDPRRRGPAPRRRPRRCDGHRPGPRARRDRRPPSSSPPSRSTPPAPRSR